VKDLTYKSFNNNKKKSQEASNMLYYIPLSRGKTLNHNLTHRSLKFNLLFANITC